MRLTLCMLFMALTGMPASLIAAETPSNAEISKRLRALENRIERLERREKAETRQEKKAEAKAKTAAASKVPSAADWQKVKFGMMQTQVREILGEPLRTRNTAEHTIWSWHPVSTPGGEVWFKDQVAERVFPPK
jgi:hypothetical protein